MPSVNRRHRQMSHLQTQQNVRGYLYWAILGDCQLPIINTIFTSVSITEKVYGSQEMSSSLLSGWCTPDNCRLMNGQEIAYKLPNLTL